MFNFLVTGYDITAPQGSFVLGADRVFNHTDNVLEARYNSGNVLDQSGVMALPSSQTNRTVALRTG